MKYIKKIERVFNNIKSLKLSKYILIQKPRDTNTYFVLEVSYEPDGVFDDESIQCKKLYTYSKSENYLRKNKHQFFNINIKTELPYIVYQSDIINIMINIIYNTILTFNKN